jgi:uncharacterized protein YgiM (DUF1202 family)
MRLIQRPTMEYSMQKFLPMAAMLGGLACSFSAGAENFYASESDSPHAGYQTSGMMRQTMVVGVDRGTVRERPNTRSKLLTTLPRGYRVTVVGTANGGGWAHVMLDGLDGYIDFVQLDRAPASETYGSATSPADRMMVVTASQGSLRQRPTVESSLVSTLPRGERVTVIGTANGGGWARVVFHGVTGYMDFVQLSDLPAAPYGTSYQTTYPVYQGSYPVYQSNYATYQYGYPAQNGYPTYQSRDMTVNAAGGTVHESPDTNSRLLSVLSPGQHVAVIGTTNGGAWAHVVVAGGDGYMDYRQLQ